MRKNIRFKKLLKKYWRLPVLFLVLLFLLALSARFSGRLIHKMLTIKLEPVRLVVSEEPVVADLLFNSKPGTHLLSSAIEKEINQAQKSLEIAMYAITSETLRGAIYQAAERGVNVKMVADWGKQEDYQYFFTDMPESIFFRYAHSKDGKRSLMHHKFALIDRGEINQKLIFGAFNWTDLQEKYDPSFVLITGHSELVASFGKEFDYLVSGISGRDKLKEPDYKAWDLHLKTGNYNYETWFSPGGANDSIKSRLLSLIRDAKKEIKILIWDFTDQDVAVELVRRAREGVKVTIIAETWNFNNEQSVFRYFLGAKLKYNLANLIIISDYESGELAKAVLAEDDLREDFDPFLHHHLLLVDDKTALFGTNNWSKGGSFFNDESMMVTDDPSLVQRFAQEFNYFLDINLNQPID